ncbi:hypothetical protein RCL1_005683 [Eukaryota sp. TZLM3-RCL]
MLLQQLRSTLRDYNIDVLYLNHTDAHSSEYPPLREYRVKFLTQFSGSSASCIITQEHALLFTDSRYYLQAERESPDWTLMKTSEPDSQSPKNWMKKNLSQGKRVGFFHELMTIQSFKELNKTLSSEGISLIPMKTDIVGELWEKSRETRPHFPQSKLRLRSLEFTGASCLDKINLLRGIASERRVTCLFVCSLPEIAWLFNLDATDIPFTSTPSYTFAMVTMSSVHLFVKKHREFGSKIRESLEEAGVLIGDYDLVDEELIKMIDDQTQKVLIPETTPVSLLSRYLDNLPSNLIVSESIIVAIKVQKNSVEQKAQKQASIKDSAALCEAFAFVTNTIKNGYSTLTEEEISDFLIEKRQDRSNFIGPSFESIVAASGNAAIVHYRPQTNTKVEQNSLLLIDSGGSYLEGTTDVTRVLSLYNDLEVPLYMKQRYTDVLNGHLALLCAIFPKGTRGMDLDYTARSFLYKNKLNYGHGTGHFVGLREVHENPSGISKKGSFELKTGCILSNEPGYYKENDFGIRIENLMMVVPTDSDCTDWLKFETLTFVPYEKSLILLDQLPSDHLKFLKEYYAEIRRLIIPLVNQEAREWIEHQICI